MHRAQNRTDHTRAANEARATLTTLGVPTQVTRLQIGPKPPSVRSMTSPHSRKPTTGCEPIIEAGPTLTGRTRGRHQFGPGADDHEVDDLPASVGQLYIIYQYRPVGLLFGPPKESAPPRAAKGRGFWRP